MLLLPRLRLSQPVLWWLGRQLRRLRRQLSALLWVVPRLPETSLAKRVLVHPVDLMPRPLRDLLRGVVLLPLTASLLRLLTRLLVLLLLHLLVGERGLLQ